MATPANLHEGFRGGRSTQAETLARFLEDADRLPGIIAIHRAMRGAMDLRPGMRVLDAGCGIGLEAWRLAAGHPHAHVTGLDLNAELLRIARSRPATPADNLQWTEGDLADLRLADASFDVVRTERVLMYLPDPVFEQVLDDVLRIVRPGGQLVLFELDYGATILPDAGHEEDVVRRAHQRLERSLPQPWAGRRLPGLLLQRGLRDVVAAPYAFAASVPVWRRIVHDTLRATLDDRPDPALSAWLVDAEQVVADGGLPAVFTGILTTACVPS